MLCILCDSVSDTFQSALHIVAHLIPKQPYEGGAIIILTL